MVAILYRGRWVKPNDAVGGILQKNWVITTAADALVPLDARTSAAIDGPDFHGKCYQRSEPVKCPEIIENANTLRSPEKNNSI